LLVDLGMDSLMALEIQEAIKLATDQDIDVRDILRRASVDWLEGLELEPV
jgi:hypothetical protein